MPGDRDAHISFDVLGDPADPRTVDRSLIFEPIGQEIARQMEQVMGTLSIPWAICLPAAVEPSLIVESKMIQCDSCRAFVAMLMFAPEATDVGHFEDCARLMYPEYSRHDLPTWIIGPAFGLGSRAPADIMQVWPVRKSLQRLQPGQFNSKINRLVARHCRHATGAVRTKARG